jgi:hypothetical protein
MLRSVKKGGLREGIAREGIGHVYFSEQIPAISTVNGHM